MSRALETGRRNRGQATLEYVVVLGTVILPLIFSLLVTAQILWVWHSVADFTREGAQHAATRCWHSSGENVRNWMTAHVPLMVDIDRFQGGDAQINIEYFERDPDSGTLLPFSCAGSECSPDCVPDVVTVSISNYQYRAGFLSYMGVGPITIPDFRTSMPMESAGCAADAGGVVACAP